MVVGAILRMTGKALAKKFLSKPVKTFKAVSKVTPHFKKKLVAGAIGGGVAGGYLGKGTKSIGRIFGAEKKKKKKD